MNRYPILRIFVSVLILFISSCTPESDFQIIPETVVSPTINEEVITIDALLGILGQQIEVDGEQAKVVFEDTNTAIAGYVISSDKAGNFFKEMIIQDQVANPLTGLRVLLDVSPLYTTFEFGRKVYIKLDGLSIGIENGVPTLGVLEGTVMGAIPSFSVENTIIRSSEIAEIQPLDVRIDDFSDRLLNLYVAVDEVQFNKSMVASENVFTFAAEPHDLYDGERILESCSSGRSVIVSTSVYSDFKAVALPTGTGRIEGILVKNYDGDTYNLVVNDPTHVAFDTATRCDPTVLECQSTQEGTDILFEESFTDRRTSDLEALGWINSNQYDGDLEYETGSFNGNDYIQISGYNSDEPLYEVWLITPEITLNESEHEALYFDIQAAYDNGNILEVMISNDFTDTIATSTWTQLDVLVPRSPITGFGSFSSFGPISLSCLEGTVRVGFRYTGGDPKATTRYHIDNVRIMGVKEELF